MSRAVVVVLAALALFGCRSKKETPGPGASASPIASAPSPAASKELAVSDPEPPELPTESDFEAEAAEQIKGANLERELDRLEKELIGR